MSIERSTLPPRSKQLVGVATMLASTLSNQCGAALGALAFPAMGPLGVVSVRQFIAAGALAVVAPPRFRSLTRRQWWPIIVLGAVFGAMNLTLYSAVDRLGLALAVTLEFLGPLGVVLATSRRWFDAICGGAALIGVVVLTAPRPSSDVVGLAFGLASALAWAAYILLNRLVGARIAGLRGTSAAAAISAFAWAPVGIAVLVSRPPESLAPVGLAIACGLLSSAIPYLADLVTLRRISASLFGVFMSLNPVYAAVAGFIILDQRLEAHEWTGIVVIVVTDAAATIASVRPRATPVRRG